jgi:hypothetical protein
MSDEERNRPTYLFLSHPRQRHIGLQPLCVLLYSKIRLIGAGTAETPVSVFQKLAKAGENHSVTRSRARSRLVHRHDVGCRVSIPCRARERRKRRYSMKMPSPLEISRRMGKVAVGSTGSTVSLDRRHGPHTPNGSVAHWGQGAIAEVVRSKSIIRRY